MAFLKLATFPFIRWVYFINWFFEYYNITNNWWLSMQNYYSHLLTRRVWKLSAVHVQLKVPASEALISGHIESCKKEQSKGFIRSIFLDLTFCEGKVHMVSAASTLTKRHIFAFILSHPSAVSFMWHDQGNWCNILIRHHSPVHIRGMYKWNTNLCMPLDCTVCHLAFTV